MEPLTLAKALNGRSLSSPLFSSHSLLLVVAVVVGVALTQLPLTVAVALVGGTAVILLTLISPLFGLAITLFLAPLGALENRLWGNSIDSGQIFLFFTLAVWVGRGLIYQRIKLPKTYLNLPLILFISYTILTLFQAEAWSYGLKEIAKWVEMLLIIWLIVDLADITTPTASINNGLSATRILIFLLIVFLIGGVLQAAVGIWQFGLQPDGPVHFLILGRFYRAFGTFDQPNPFGGFMNLSALLGVGVSGGVAVALWRKWKGELGDWSLEFGQGYVMRNMHYIAFALFVFMATAVSLGGLVASWSRGAWLGFAGGTAVLVFYWPKKRKHGLTLLLVGAILFFGAMQFNLLPASIADRLTNFGDGVPINDVRGVDVNDSNFAVVERLAHWQAATGMARDHFWFGVGFGNYEPAYADYALINWPAPLGHAHNYYLNLLAEVGVVGLGLYLLFWTAVFWQNIRLLPQLDGVPRSIALGLLACWSAIAVHHVVDKLYVNNIYIHLGVMLGLLQLLQLMAKKGTHS